MMNEKHFYIEESLSVQKFGNSETYFQELPVKQTLQEKYSSEKYENHEAMSPAKHWCETFSSLSNSNAKQAWKNGAGKLSQTLNNVRTTFGILSQRIKKSTRKRQPLINLESPKSPVTPYTRSKAALGRTPTKLYSPFSIDTPKGKENVLSRINKNKSHSYNSIIKGGTNSVRKTKLDLGTCESSSNFKETVLENELIQTQIGIYEFQSIANKIVQVDSHH